MLGPAAIERGITRGYPTQSSRVEGSPGQEIGRRGTFRDHWKGLGRSLHVEQDASTDRTRDSAGNSADRDRGVTTLRAWDRPGLSVEPLP